MKPGEEFVVGAVIALVGLVLFSFPVTFLFLLVAAFLWVRATYNLIHDGR